MDSPKIIVESRLESSFRDTKEPNMVEIRDYEKICLEKEAQLASF